jgi:caa(3)-type oxidase subunit IV
VTKQTRTYLAVFGALAALTVLTVAAARWQLGTGAAVAIALVKASLVGAFFMHLKGEGKFTRFVALFPVALFLILLLLLWPDFREP